MLTVTSHGRRAKRDVWQHVEIKVWQRVMWSVQLFREGEKGSTQHQVFFPVPNMKGNIGSMRSSHSFPYPQNHVMDEKHGYRPHHIYKTTKRLYQYKKSNNIWSHFSVAVHNYYTTFHPCVVREWLDSKDAVTNCFLPFLPFTTIMFLKLLFFYLKKSFH